MNPSLRTSPVTVLALGLLGALGIALTLLLWPHWRQNPDLSHGFFMPVVFVVLIWESRRGTPRYIENRSLVWCLLLGACALGLLALGASGLYAAALEWSHALVGFTLTAAYVCLLAAGLAVFSSGDVRLIPFNWSSIAAAGLWLLAAPIPPGSYSKLTLSLQLMVTSNVIGTLHLLGIAATRDGNIINLATTTVGVEEACSGVRSLISCIFAGLLFSATLVRRPWARAWVIGLAAPLALLMNFIRSLILTLLANHGVQIAGTWHDLTGFAVLGVTAILLGGLALALESRVPAVPAAPAPAQRRFPPLSLALASGLLFAVALAGFFYASTRPSIRHDLPAPDLAAILPPKVEGWAVETSDDLYRFSSTLKTDYLAQRTYLRNTPQGVEQITVYLAYWRAGQASVSLVASHTPDACWPGSGWEPAKQPPPTVPLAINGRSLPAVEYRQFLGSDNYQQNVWFWHTYDGKAIAYRNPYSARELLNIAWHYGFRRDGDQMFVRVSSNRPWSDLAREPFLAGIFDQLRGYGL
ncbi:MAG: exosortase/archaeosortase family protein [Verrucomicrobia bacterium]|nr:exosortase/archaeosortase family protein [Verrucomicrobiota bacterium]